MLACGVSSMLGRPDLSGCGAKPSWSPSAMSGVTLTKSGCMVNPLPSWRTATMAAAGSPFTVQDKSAKLSNVPDVSAAKACWWAVVMWVVCFCHWGILLGWLPLAQTEENGRESGRRTRRARGPTRWWCGRALRRQRDRPGFVQPEGKAGQETPWRRHGHLACQTAGMLAC